MQWWIVNQSIVFYSQRCLQPNLLRRRDLFARFLDNGRICLTNNAVERALRPQALGRNSWLFAGSDRGGVRAAVPR